MNKRYPTVSAASAVNERLQCSVPGCTKHRDGISLYCRHHKLKAQHYGSPEGQSLYTDGGGRLYASVLHAVHELLINHAGSDPVQAALNAVTRWIDAAKAGSDVPGSRLLKRITTKEDTHLPIIEEVSAAYTYIRMRMGFSDKETVYALGNALYRWVPKEWQRRVSSTGRTYMKPTIKISPKEREAIGQHVMDELGIFMENVLSHYKHMREHEQTLKHAMASPL